MPSIAKALAVFPKSVWQSVVGRVARRDGDKRGWDVEWGITRTTTLISSPDGWAISYTTSRGILACGDLYDVLGKEASLEQAQRFVEAEARRIEGPDVLIEWAASPHGAMWVGTYVRPRFARWRRRFTRSNTPAGNSFEREEDAWRSYTDRVWQVEMGPSCAALIGIDESFIKVQDIDENGEAQVRTCWKGADPDSGVVALRNILGLWQLFPGPDGPVLLRFETEGDFQEFSMMIHQHNWTTNDST